MWFKLAALLGKTVRQLQDEMSAREFAEWSVFMSIEPMGEDRMEVLAATSQMAMLAPHMKQPPKFEDCVNDYWRENSAQQSQNEIMNRLNAFAMAHNSAVKDKADGTN